MPAIWTDPSSHWRRGPRRSNRCRAACAEAGRRTARRGRRHDPQPGQGVSRGRHGRVAARKQGRRPGRQASDATGSIRRRRRGPAPQNRGAGTGERGDAGGGGGVRLFQGKVRVPQDQGHAQDRRLGEGAPQNHSRGWSDGACSLTTRVRLMRGRGHAGSRRPRRPRFHGWDAEGEMARGHHPGSGPGTGRRASRRRSAATMAGSSRTRPVPVPTPGSPTGCSSRPRRRCPRTRGPWCIPTADATAGSPDGWRSWTATARRGRRAPKAVPRTTPPRRGSSNA